jgi:hypothetical protein
MDGTGSRFVSVLDFGISDVETSGSISKNWATQHHFFLVSLFV